MNSLHGSTLKEFGSVLLQFWKWVEIKSFLEILRHLQD